MDIDEVLWKKIIFYSFISGDINFWMFIVVQNLKTWVKCTLSIIYDQFSKTNQTQIILVFESWIGMDITEVLLKK